MSRAGRPGLGKVGFGDEPCAASTGDGRDLLAAASASTPVVRPRQRGLLGRLWRQHAHDPGTRDVSTPMPDDDPVTAR